MWNIIDTPQFQSLRNLKQLSIIHFIYMGNNHTRFEHCLGTGFLSRDLIYRCFDIVNKNNKTDFQIDKNEADYLIKYLIDENQIDGINEDMLKMINSLIEGLIYIILNIIGFIKL